MQIRDRITDFRRVPASDLLPNPKNWRTHPAAQADALRGVLGEVGFADAVLARETENGLMLIDGHLRAEVAPDASVPVLVLDVTQDEADKILATHDPLAAMATTDAGKLADLLEGMRFDSDAATAMTESLAKAEGVEQAAEVVEDEVPEPPADPVTQPGDLITLGEHRVLCGDATERRSYRELLGTVKPALVVSDPPYGVAYKDAGGDRIQGDLTQAAFPISIACVVEAIDDNARVYFFCANDQLAMVDRVFNHHLGLRPRINVWKKEAFVLRRVGYHSQFEFCAYGWKGSGGGMDFWYGDRKQSDIWDVARDPDRVHPTQKPVAVCCIPIVNSSSERDAVLDPFLGSGTTLIAAEQLGRKCYGLEISPAYCDVIVNRWESLTGRKAERHG